MVFNSENSSFSAKLFSLKNECNNFSNILKNDKEDEFNYDENIDDNFISLSTEFSSLSSITTTTSAYSSCSESSNFVSGFSREIENIIEDEFSESVDSNLFYQQILAYIDFHYDHKRKLIATKVSNLSDLKQSKQFWSFICQKNVDNFPKQDFMLNVAKILLSISTLENELLKFIDDNFIFEHEFILNLAFLLYENCERVANFESNSNLIFEIDLNHQCEENFEKLLKFLVEKYVSKYIPLLICQENFEYISGKFWIGLFKILFENESFNDFFLANNPKNTEYFQYENFLDNEIFLSEPIVLNDYSEFKNSNPISQGYRELLDNLKRLQYICNDPINDYQNESELYGRVFHDRSKFFSYFSASYYTMGLFDLKKSLFDNPLQSLYENKLLNEEYSKVFKNDSISNEWKKKMIESLKITPDEFSVLFESVKTKQKCKTKEVNCRKSQWNIEYKDNKTTKQNEQKILKSTYEEIIERLQSLNTSYLFNSYFKTIHQYQSECSCEDFSPNKDKKNDSIQSSRKWTVAPKLFAKNTTSNCIKRTILTSNTCINYTPESLKRYDEYTEMRTRSDLRPIGTRPASMFTISSFNRNRGQNKFLPVINATKESWDIVDTLID